jgi:UDP-glucuronate decarboxylase
MNLGNDVEFTILDLAQLVIRLTDSASRVVFDQEVNLGDDPLRRRPDLSLARSALGYAARVSLEEGPKKTIAYYSTVERLLIEQALGWGSRKG